MADQRKVGSEQSSEIPLMQLSAFLRTFIWTNRHQDKLIDQLQPLPVPLTQRYDVTASSDATHKWCKPASGI